MINDSTEFDALDEARQEIDRLRALVRDLENDPDQSERNTHTQTALERKLYHLYNELLLSHTPNMVFLFNENLEYVIGSTACYKLTHQNRTDLALTPLPEVFSDEVDKDWVNKIHMLNKDVFASGKTVTFNDAIDVEGEETAQVHITISPMIDDNGCKRGTFMAINDVIELVTAQRQAEEAAAAKTRFLANMSHEIRTPVNAIKGLSELLAVTHLTDSQRVYIENIIASSNSLVNVINDVLDFSKIDANRIEIIPAQYSLNKLISDLCGVIALRAEEKGLDMFLDVHPTLPSQIFGDDNRIKQVLLNLLSNAVKYTNTGHVFLRADCQPLSDDMINLRFTVEDTGIGVRKEDMPLLFNAFSRVDLKANRSIQGTGLGLAISKYLAEAMDGSITLHSVYGRGSTFVFSIPQKIVSNKPIAHVERPDTVCVLLIGTGQRMVNAANSLRRMGVDFAMFAEENDDDTLLHLLSDPDASRSRIDKLAKPFTHCMYTEIIPKGDLAGLRRYMAGCRFALLRSLLNNINGERSEDFTLFYPLMVSQIAKFLIQQGRSISGRHKAVGAGSSSNTGKLQVNDAVALVVDDNRINLMVCEKMLNIYGLVVRTASSGPEALHLCSRHSFDIIFVDHMMPGMDGLEVTAEIRSHSELNSDTPIVALTANVISEMRKKYLKCGMDDFVSKPIDRKELSRVLQEWLPQHKIIGVPNHGN